MVNFSKEINKENKTNIQELTKQAVKTIKVFYNTMNNTTYNEYDSGNRIEFKNEETSFDKFEDIIKQGRASFLLEDGLSGMMYIPPGIKTISKEFLIDMNFKTELIKGELYTSLIREMNFMNFLVQIFDKLNINDMETIKNICTKVITLKIEYEKLLNQNNKLKKENLILKQNIKNNDLYIQKLKENVNNNLYKLKERYLKLTNNIDSKVKAVKNNNIILKEKGRKDKEKMKAEMAILKNEIVKLKKENLELKKQIGEITDKNYNDNNKIINSNEENKINDINNQEKINGKIRNFEIEYINNFNYIGNIKKEDNKILITNQKNNIINNDNNNLNYNYGDNININSNKEFNSKENIISDYQNNINNNNLNYNNIINNQENINNIIQNERYKEINSKKIDELQNLLSEEKNKNTELIKEINSLKLYSDDLNKNISLLKKNTKENIFTPKLFIKLFFKINQKIFSSSEYKKFLQIYNLKDIYSIYDAFKKNCQILKRKIYETHFEINTTNTNTEIDENLITTNNNNSKRNLINSSYKAVNERILKLKKFEFDMIILNEFVKNYMVSQESIIKMIFNGNNNVIQFEIIENLYKLLEEGLNFKIDEMNDNVIFQRKLYIKFFKNQKNCLGLSLEYISS